MMLQRAKAALIGLTLACATSVSAFAGQLVMYESDNCVYCEKWLREVGPSYGSTREGRMLPLRRVDVNQPAPADLATIYPPSQTPTFVVIENGREYGRIVGYPGRTRFWDMLRVGINRIHARR